MRFTLQKPDLIEVSFNVHRCDGGRKPPMSIRSTHCADFARNSPDIQLARPVLQKVGDIWHPRVGGQLPVLRGSAKAIEESEQHDADARSDNRVEEQAQGKEWSGMVEQKHPEGENHHRLMEMEQQEDQAEAGDGMFSIDARADGRSEITDDRLRDSIEADGIIMTESVLNEPDSRPEKQA
jgi:hypothetical protein